MAKKTTTVKKESVDKAGIEERLYMKKMQKFVWQDDKLVAIICPDGTRLDFDNLTIK